jgi:hypothetical protein
MKADIRETEDGGVMLILGENKSYELMLVSKSAHDRFFWAVAGPEPGEVEAGALEASPKFCCVLRRLLEMYGANDSLKDG